MRYKAFYVVASVVATGVAMMILWTPAVISQINVPPPAGVQFRVAVGLKDTTPADWKGRVTVSGGELAGIKGWRFSQGDSVSAAGEFAFQTRIGQMENQLGKQFPYGQTDWGDPAIKRLVPEGLVLLVRGGEAAQVTVDLGTQRISFRSSEVPLGKPMNALAGNARVERMPVEQTLSEAGKADDWPSVATAPDGTRWATWLAYENAADEVLVSGAGVLHRLTSRGDHHSPVIAAEGNGGVTVVWSQNDKGLWTLYGAKWLNGQWSKPEKLSGGDGSNIWPALASDGKDRLALVWQAFRGNQSVIQGRLWDGKSWGPEIRISEGEGNAWMPALAFGGGKLWVVWDSYNPGSYQVYAREWGKGVERVTRGDNFSVHASVAVMATGIPVVAWEESDAQWGKDFAFLYDRRGTTLYKNRSIRVAWRDGATWKETGSKVATALPEDIRRFAQQPRLAAGADGSLYLVFRVRTSASTARIDYWSAGGRWETFLTALDGDRWASAVPLPSSLGRSSMRASLALAKETVHVVWPTDNRVWPQGRYGDLDIEAAAMPAFAKQARLDYTRPIEATPVAEVVVHPREASDIRRIREYRYSVSGKTYRVLRGDLHRHTELSGDGAGDGSLDDLYRYFLDAGGMDYAHVADHQMGNDEEYNWWITQKSNDLYYMPNRLVPMYGYERSVRYPNGHRNVVWAERGRPVLKIGPKEANGDEDTGRVLYPYLRETKGVVTSHTSATQQGTDWRDNDPGLEPVVEIYQGFESSYEHQGAPRTWKEGEKTVHQGLKPLGFIWNAWAKGYKLGVQSSSDHVSTHVSYACVLAEDFTRAGILDALRKRHAYAATDNIVLDYRVATPDKGTVLMGDIVDTSGEPKLMVKVIGTGKVKQIDVIKNNAYIHKVNPDSQETEFEYQDRSSAPGESYYYVRVEQADGQLAWSSPIWVRRR